jgi:transposase
MAGQTEDSEEVTVVERRFAILKHQRKKYRCACNGCLDTAPGPVKLHPGSRYSTAFAVEVVVNKYLDHLPLERQARIMRREGLTIDSQTLWDQLDVLATVLQPTYDALVRHVLAAEVVGADETWWRLMDTRGSQRWWVWSVTREDAVIYKALPSRSLEAARQVLNGYRGFRIPAGRSSISSAGSTPWRRRSRRRSSRTRCSARTLSIGAGSCGRNAPGPSWPPSATGPAPGSRRRCRRAASARRSPTCWVCGPG